MNIVVYICKASNDHIYYDPLYIRLNNIDQYERERVHGFSS